MDRAWNNVRAGLNNYRDIVNSQEKRTELRPHLCKQRAAIPFRYTGAQLRQSR